MSRPAALPTRPARTMLFPVNGNPLLRGLRACSRRWRLALASAVALGTLLPTSSALAQHADDRGWFDAAA
jgi:hypothetical protein